MEKYDLMGSSKVVNYGANDYDTIRNYLLKIL